MQQKGSEVLIKKYSNRRLYDTSESRYITLDELAESIRSGKTVRVADAKSGNDLTQATLAQIILESRRAARLLPVPLLTQLIRMGDDALAEFFGKYMSWALELYSSAKQGAQAISPFNPLATLPFAATNAIARMFSNGGGGAPWQQEHTNDPPVGAPAPPEAPETNQDNGQRDDIAELKREIEALKEILVNKKVT